MNSRQYSNIIQWTLKHEVVETFDTLCTARTVFRNMGIALPQGTQQEVFKIIDTNRYMWWRTVSAEDAQQAADNGVAAIGINVSDIIILVPNDSEFQFDKKRHSSVATLSDFNETHIISSYKFFVHGLSKKDSVNIFCSSGQLSIEQMNSNAQYIFNYYKSRCWTKNAICGLLGNMQSESGINPAHWNNDESNLKIGLLQWDLQSEIIDWAHKSADPKDMNLQLKRISYELYMRKKWQSTPSCPMSFGEFTRSRLAPFHLARVFMNNYIKLSENSAEAQKRAVQAMYWFNVLK